MSGTTAQTPVPQAPAQPAPAAAPVRQSESLAARATLAKGVVFGAFVGIFLMVGTLLGLAQSAPAVNETAKNLFNAVLPVLAGWVGTVLAFYFSAASQESTAASLNLAMEKSGTTTPGGVPVAEIMLPYASIAELQHLEKTPPDQLTVGALDTSFSQKLPNGRLVQRLVFVENGVFKYVMHSSVLSAFKAKNPPAPDQTLQGMLNDPAILAQISKLVVVVAASATVGTAKAAMESITGASDIIVTASGLQNAPMLGWLTDTDLTTALTAK